MKQKQLLIYLGVATLQFLLFDLLYDNDIINELVWILSYIALVEVFIIWSVISAIQCFKTAFGKKNNVY